MLHHRLCLFAGLFFSIPAFTSLDLKRTLALKKIFVAGMRPFGLRRGFAAFGQGLPLRGYAMTLRVKIAIASPTASRPRRKPRYYA
jgi:hypothetical protein